MRRAAGDRRRAPAARPAPSPGVKRAVADARRAGTAAVPRVGAQLVAGAPAGRSRRAAPRRRWRATTTSRQPIREPKLRSRKRRAACRSRGRARRPRRSAASSSPPAPGARSARRSADAAARGRPSTVSSSLRGQRSRGEAAPRAIRSPRLEGRDLGHVEHVEHVDAVARDARSRCSWLTVKLPSGCASGGGRRERAPRARRARRERASSTRASCAIGAQSEREVRVQSRARARTSGFARRAWPRQRSIIPRWKCRDASLRAEPERALRVAQRLAAAAVRGRAPKPSTSSAWIDGRSRCARRARARAPRASRMPWSTSKSAVSRSVLDAVRDEQALDRADELVLLARRAPSGRAARRGRRAVPTNCGSGTRVDRLRASSIAARGRARARPRPARAPSSAKT